MAMEKRVGFTLDHKQVEQACVAFVAPRLQADEQARADLNVDTDGLVSCTVDVSKKRVRKAKAAP